MESEEILLKCGCDFCGQHIEYPASYAGESVKCPSCEQEIILPELAARVIRTGAISEPRPLPTIASTPQSTAAPQAPDAAGILPFVEYSNASLQILQKHGLVRKRIKQETLEQLSDKPWDSIYHRHPELLTKLGIQMGVDCEMHLQRLHQVAQMDLRSIAGLRGADEEDATEKQTQFIRSLGVTDESLLSNISKRQASRILDKVLGNSE